MPKKLRSLDRLNRISNCIVLLKGERSQSNLELESFEKKDLEFFDNLEFVLIREDEIEKLNKCIDILTNFYRSEYNNYLTSVK
jgi:hypothetical protein